MNRHVRTLSISCSVFAFASAFAASVPMAMAQTPSNEQLYQMILELKQKQDQMEHKLEAAYAETAHVKEELAALRSAVAHSPDRASITAAERRMYLAGPLSDTRAVAAPNMRAGVGVGVNDGDAYAYTDGSVAVPLGDKYGFQIDAIGGVSADNNFNGAAVHLFRRDPKVGALGVYGSYLYGSGGYDDGDTLDNGYVEAKLGVEGQYYLDRVTLEGIAGVEWNSLEEAFSPFAEGRVGYYPTDNFKVNAGLRYRGAFDDATQLVGGAEYLTEFGGTGVATSLYGDVAVNLNNTDSYSSGDVSAMAGLRFHLGTNNVQSGPKTVFCKDPAQNYECDVTDGQNDYYADKPGRSLIQRDRGDYMPSRLAGEVGNMPKPSTDEWGQPGLPGLPGIPGSPGAPGTPGSDGSDGTPGTPGAPGTPGSDGSDGTPGTPGSPGEPGVPGSPGEPGGPGDPGVPGEPGTPGEPGSPGEPGVPGDQGPPGAPGEPGVPGF